MTTIGKSDDGKDQAPMSDLEAAAKRFRCGLNYGECPNNWQECNDARLLAEEWLAEHDPTPIDANWLRSLGAEKDDNPQKWTLYRGDPLPIGLWSVDDGWKAMLVHGRGFESCIVRRLKTRGQLRRLATALGITLKAEK